MTRDDIIRMAREAGFTTTEYWPDAYPWLCETVERFAALVAAAEREACARLADLAAVESAQTLATCIKNEKAGPALVAVGAKSQSEKLAPQPSEQEVNNEPDKAPAAGLPALPHVQARTDRIGLHGDPLRYPGHAAMTAAAPQITTEQLARLYAARNEANKRMSQALRTRDQQLIDLATQEASNFNRAYASALRGYKRQQKSARRAV